MPLVVLFVEFTGFVVFELVLFEVVLLVVVFAGFVLFVVDEFVAV